MNGKGDKRRQEDAAKIRANWDKIKWKARPVDEGVDNKTDRD